MAHSLKGPRRIVVNGFEYRWRATGNDGWISLAVRPANRIGPAIGCHFNYQESWDPVGPGQWTSRGNQIVITNRLARRVILYSMETYSYDPTAPGRQLSIRDIESKIDWSDALRASPRSKP